MLSYNLVLPVPYVTFEECSRMTGIKLETVRSYVRSGKIIIQKKNGSGEKTLSNAH